MRVGRTKTTSFSVDDATRANLDATRDSAQGCSRSLARAHVLALLLAAPLTTGCASQAAAPPNSASEAAWGDVTAQVPGFVRELKMLDVALPDGTHAKLDALVTRPAIEAPVPLVLLAHGRPSAKERAEFSPTRFSGEALALAKRGYAVVVVLRRGYGHSTGPEVDDPGPCARADYEGAAQRAAEDLDGALSALATEPWLDPTNIVILGHGGASGGLFALAAAAAMPAGGPLSIKGVVSLSRFGAVCHDERLVAAMTSLGKRAPAPALWVETAKNPPEHGDDLARRMTDAFHAAGGSVELVLAPATEVKGADAWWPVVAPFLARQKLPTADPLPGQVPENAPLAVPTVLGADGQKAFADYLAHDDYEKAFVIGQTSTAWSYGQRTMTDAMFKAVEICKARGDRGCRPYAVGNEYAPGMKDHPPVRWVRGWCVHHTGGHWNDVYPCWTRSDQK